MPRRLLHWDEHAVVLNGGARAARGEPADACGRALRSMYIRWEEISRIEPVDPFPTLAIECRTNQIRQRELVRPNRRVPLEPFADLALAFLDEAKKRRPSAVLPGWTELAVVPWEPVPSMPNEAVRTHGGAYRISFRAESVVATRTPARLSERVLMGFGAETVSREDSGFELLADEPFPWTVAGAHVVLTSEHAYVRDRGVSGRLPLDLLRRRIALSRFVVYLFGRRTILVVSDRPSCPVQRILDDRLSPWARLALGRNRG
jgi:hypothetical protein